MMEAGPLVHELLDRGITLMSGVPCSFLTPVINQAISDPGIRYLAATQEGEAAAIAAGAWLGGGLGCVIGQNSGLGNMVNPLTSLLHTACIPALLLVTWRGEPGLRDEPQHELMGRTMTGLLDLMEIPWDVLPIDTGPVPPILDSAWQHMASGRRPYAIVVRKDTVGPNPLDEADLAPVTASVVRSTQPAQRPTRAAVLAQLLDIVPDDTAIITTTGFTSRELYTIDDRPSNFYLVGAMGSAAAVGLGVAQHTARPVLVVDGDGALLMRLGTLATVGAYGRGGLVHLVLDNGQHESTGGQRTVTSRTDIPAAAAACGYRQVYACATQEEVAQSLAAALRRPGPALIHLPIRPGALSGLGRPRVTPAEVAQRFRDFVSTPAAALLGEAR